MKIPAALVVSLAVSMSAYAQTSTPPSGSTKSGSSKIRIVLPDDPPAAKSPEKAKAADTAKSADDAKKGTPKSAKKEEPRIEGMEIPRGAERGFLGLQIANSTFKLSFYDKTKKPVDADVARAVLRWDPKYKVGEERVVLNPTEDGKALSSPKNIRPPYNFKLFITLLKSAAEGAEPTVSETYVVDFRQ